MIEVLVLVAATGAMLLVWNRVQVARSMDETDTSVAKHGVLIQAGVNKYINDNRLTFLNSAAPAITGFSAPFAPTMRELQASPADNPYIPSGYNLANQLGMTYTVNLSLLPAGCTPNVNCTDVTGTVVSVAPLLDPTTNPAMADGKRVGNIANKIGIDAASSKVGAGTLLTGPAGDWALTNPRGNVPGILAMRVGYGSVASNGLDHLLPRDGSRPMAGTLRLGGNPIADASTIAATSHISTTGGNITTNTGSITTTSGSITTSSGSITTASGNITATNGKVSGTYFAPGVQTPGASCTDLRAIGTAANGAVLVCRGNAWRANVGPFAEKGDACTRPGQLATTWTTDEAVMCRGTTYVSLANQIGKYVEISRQSVVDGSVVPHATCDVGGTPTFRFGMVQTAVDVSSAPPKQVTNLTAIANANSWTVSYKLRDDMGNQTSANVYNLQALMYLECKYP
ncbi:hypothetical protein ACFPOU_08170 [Massilia jejuensis]|uniref:Shufflon protein n=1 Tax=Massilia jejuensis TaxID=648894 RepID=A0ABW0PEL7_9BURK